ncbi:MAG: DNA polymerase III subunit delta [Oscillospiraceae bacterium]|nr:DNA polymerase III subunit delta [Oscillospiraceae bacterium]
MRALLCPDGLDGFNYTRLEGKGLEANEIKDAVDTFPAFAEKTLVEIHDYDLFKGDDKESLCKIFSDLPDYVCIVFIYSTIEYKPDSRQKQNKEILKHANVVEFVVQEQDKLIKWIRRHFMDAGKNISSDDAQYLAFITGGLMATLNGEIEKAAAYSKHDRITRNDIDAVVTPVLDTVAYKLTDALVSRDNIRALRLLDELFQMREAPHKLMFSISLKMRQLLAARICIENNLSKTKLMEMCGIRHEFQANTLMSTARKATLPECRNAVISCSETALELNSSPEPESRMIELVTKLAFGELHK